MNTLQSLTSRVIAKDIDLVEKLKDENIMIRLQLPAFYTPNSLAYVGIRISGNTDPLLRLLDMGIQRLSISTLSHFQIPYTEEVELIRCFHVKVSCEELNLIDCKNITATCEDATMDNCCDIDVTTKYLYMQDCSMFEISN
jgi:hypothetical protein